ncbi:MAG: serine/threonine-protein kinase PknK, partial [Nitrospirae bacterium]|nr:serine/threonine-protein kinase PknK [Nitrospirota bacterium]
MQIAGYKINNKIQEDAQSIICRGYREYDNRPVLFKIGKKQHSSNVSSDGIYKSYELSKNLDIDGILKPYAVEWQSGVSALVLEDFDGRLLKNAVSDKFFDTKSFLKTAINLCDALSSIHNHDIIHGVIKSSNIFINQDLGNVKFVDLGLAMLFQRGTQIPRSYYPVLGTADYVSPEQTGRVDYLVDSRTDLYSLGIIFYEMLTGRLPFLARDVLEMISCHIAKLPIPPHEHNNAIPVVLSDIVLKLLAKSPDERYQSAYGLKSDLKKCLDDFDNHRNVEAFPLGRLDASITLPISSRLYGRENELMLLSEAFDRSCKKRSEVMLVAGYSGIGKSLLVNELYKDVIKTDGFFISGKFDQYKRNIPYSALIEAFNSLIQKILSSDETKLRSWKAGIEKALGADGAIITEILPDLEFVIGRQPAVQQLPAKEAQYRFHLVFRKFMSVFATSEHPLALFLDDLQWADAATLKLIKYLTADAPSKAVLFIAAYRDNEVSPEHPVIKSVIAMKEAGAVVNTIELQPIKTGSIKKLLSDTLNCGEDKVESLSSLIMNKTGGNPYFLHQFLKALYAKKLLGFDSDSRLWTWNENKIKEIESTENVLEMIFVRINELSTEAREFISIASCMGNTFDLQVLADIRDRSEAETFSAVFELINMGLITSGLFSRKGTIKNITEASISKKSLAFRFSHDRVQQAAYTLLPKSKRAETHLKIANYMIAHSEEDEFEDSIFEVANQFNNSIDLITEQDYKHKVSKLYLTAALKAKAATAYEPALRYIKTGMLLLPPESWTSDYELTFLFQITRAECEYLNGHFDDSDAVLSDIFRHARSNLDNARAYEIKINLYNNQDRMKDAVEIGLDALRLFGIDLPDNQEDIGRALEAEANEAKGNLLNYKIEDIVDLPQMTDSEMQTAISILVMLSPPAYQYNPDLWVLSVIKMFNISIKHGNSPKSSYGYMAYAIILGSGFGDYESSYRIGLMALELNKRINEATLTAKLPFLFGNFVAHWRVHGRHSQEYLSQGFRYGSEYGDFLYMGYAAFHLLRNRLLLGENLDEIYQGAAKTLDLLIRSKDHNTVSYVINMQLIKNLQGFTASAYSLSDETFDESKVLEEIRSGSNFTTLCYYLLAKAQIFYLTGKYQEAITAASEMEDNIKAMIGKFDLGEFYIYYALSITSLYASADRKKQKAYFERLKQIKDKLRLYADNCPDNFKHIELLVDAEMSALKVGKQKTISMYESAIELAVKNGYLHHAAMVYERAALHSEAEGMKITAGLYRDEAIKGYRRWGAHSKVSAMQASGETSGIVNGGAVQMNAAEFSLSNLDLLTVTKSLNAISSSIDMKDLIKKLIDITIENVGAQKGSLLLK